jgi:DNA-directed RNA polymerase specialized sigma subunit
MTISDEERDDAFKKFFDLVGPIAGSFARVYRLPIHEVEDLKQAGYIGLLSAAKCQGKKLIRTSPH